MAYLGLLLGLAALVFIAYPLFRPGRSEAAVGETGELQNRRNATYAAIRDLDLEVEVGSLSPADASELQERYKDKAVGILKEMDEHSTESAIEQEIARRRRSAREAPTEAAEDGIEAEIALRRRVSPEGPVCPRCSQRSRPGAKFCAACGASLGASCPRCQAACQPEDKFCPECGASLQGETKA